MKTHLRAWHVWLFLGIWSAAFLIATLITGLAEQDEVGFEVPLFEAWSNLSPHDIEWEEARAGPAPDRRWVRFTAAVIPGEHCEIVENYTTGKQNTRRHRQFEVLYLRPPAGEGPILLASTRRAAALPGHVPFSELIRYRAPDPAAKGVVQTFEGMLVDDADFVNRTDLARTRGSPDWRLVLNAHPKFWAAGIGWLGILGVVIGLAALFFFRAGRAIQEVRFEIDRKDFRLGDRLRWELLVKMKSTYALDRAAIELSCTEQVVVGSGKQSRALKETSHTERRTLAERVTLDPKRPGEWRGEFHIPREAMHTYHGQPQRVTWKIAYALEIPGLLDVLGEREIVVRAERAREEVLDGGRGAPAADGGGPAAEPGSEDHSGPLSPPDNSCEILLQTGLPPVEGMAEVEVGRLVPVTIELVRPERFDSKNVKVRLKYDITGRGNPGSKVVAEETPVTGAWEAGGRGRRSLALSIPENGPISHAGKLIDIAWSVEVTVDVKWAKDPTVSIPIRVLPRGAR